MQSNLFTNVLLPLALGIVMLGMGMSLVPEDFRRITRDPKAVAVGTACQIILLPLLGALITTVVPMRPELAVGLMVLAICPGGPSSNLVTYLARGDVALSVTLTALSSVHHSPIDQSGAAALLGREHGDCATDRSNDAADCADHTGADRDRDGDPHLCPPNGEATGATGEQASRGLVGPHYYAAAGQGRRQTPWVPVSGWGGRLAA
jgi:hypothetical protein